jgi:hypothetical protein
MKGNRAEERKMGVRPRSLILLAAAAALAACGSSTGSASRPTKPPLTTTTKPPLTTTTKPPLTMTTKPPLTTTTKPPLTMTTQPVEPTIDVQVLASGTVGTYSGGGYNCNAPGDDGFACFEVAAYLLVNGYIAPTGTTTITVSTPDGQLCNRSVLDNPYPSENSCYVAVGAPTSVTVTFTFADGTSASEVTPVSPTS